MFEQLLAIGAKIWLVGYIKDLEISLDIWPASQKLFANMELFLIYVWKHTFFTCPAT